MEMIFAIFFCYINCNYILPLDSLCWFFVFKTALNNMQLKLSMTVL